VGDGQSPAAILVISSHVVRGSVGLRAAGFALETLGHPVWSVPTVTLPWHPGHGKASRIVPEPQAFADLLGDLGRAPWLGAIGGIVTGYLGAAAQAEPIAQLIHAVRGQRPDAVYCCDPVLGDKGGLYVPEATARAIRDVLLPLADIATPNRYELDWLSGAQADSNSAVVDAARRLGPKRVLVTSAHSMLKNGIGNLLLHGDRAILAEHAAIAGAPNGTGDLLAALFLSRLLHGFDDAQALQTTAASVFEIVARSVRAGSQELMLETEAASLRRAMAMVTMRQLVTKRAKSRT
jgi:pyridoxine kinase